MIPLISPAHQSDGVTVVHPPRVVYPLVWPQSGHMFIASINIAGSRSGIDQLWLNSHPQARFDGPPRNHISAPAHRGFQPFSKRNEAQADRWINFDQNVDIAIFRLLVARPRSKQSEPLQRKVLLQSWFDSSQLVQDVFT